MLGRKARGAGRRIGFAIYVCALAGAPSGALSAQPAAGGGAGARLEGVIRFTGPVPARTPLVADHDTGTCGQHPILSEELVVSPEGGVRNAVVWLEGVEGGRTWPEGDGVMDQQGCVYRPHVLVVGAGRPITFTNSDPVIHNVNTFPRENPPLNVSLLASGVGRPVRKTLKLPDEIKVTCDAHKWMSAWIIVRDDPYVAITGEDGSYAIAGIPPGTWTMVVWHETLARVEKTLTVTAGAVLTEDVALQHR